MQTFGYVFIPSELITRLKIDVRGRRLNLFIKYWKQNFDYIFICTTRSKTVQKEETMKDNFNEEINDRLENIEDSIGNIEDSIGNIEENIVNVENGLDSLETDVDNQFVEYMEIVNDKLDYIIDMLESFKK